MARSFSLNRPRVLALVLTLTTSAALAATTSCSSDSPAGASSTADGGSTTPSNDSGGPSGSTTVTAAGGSISAGGVTVTVPAGAVAGDTKIGIEVLTAPPTGTGLDGFEPMTAVVRLTPHGQTFTKPVSIELPLTGVAGPNPEARFVSDENDTSWEAVGPATVVGNLVRFETTHFSKDFVGYWRGDGGSIATDAGIPLQDGGASDGAVADTGAPVDGGAATWDCYGYATALKQYTVNALARVGDRLYFSPNDGPGLGAVHSVKTDMTDYKSYPGYSGVKAITSNVNGTFWGSTGFSDAGTAAGIYRLTASGGTPALAASLPTGTLVGTMAANDTNIFYGSFYSATGTLNKASALAASPTYVSSALPDQMELVGAYVYWVETTAQATPGFCANPMPALKRVPVAGGAIETVVDACAMLTISGKASEAISRFAISGSFVYFMSDRNVVWKAPIAGGTPSVMWSPVTNGTGRGSAVAVVGTNLIFNDYDYAPGLSDGPALRKIPLAGGTAVKIGLSNAFFSALGDAQYYYVASTTSVCRALIP